MSETVKLSIILPCYNPREGWIQNIIANYQNIASFTTDFEIIIINDGSTKNFDITTANNSFKVYPNIRLISYPVNSGKGYALRKGVAAGTGQLYIYTDIDFPYTQNSFKNVFDCLLSKKYNVVTGTRDSEYYKNLPAARIMISKFLRFLIRSFLGIPVDDTQCGLKGFDEEGKHIFLNTSINRFLFDLEFIFLAARKKLSIIPINVRLNEGVQLSVMPWRILLHEGGNFLKIFFRALFNIK
jgi:glycosyltransferase involved in cell wall biosynthesis